MNILPTLMSLIAVPQPSGPVRWSTEAFIAADGSVRVEIVAHCEEGWHIYATALPSDQGPLPTVFRFTPSNAYSTLSELQEPQAEEEFDENFGVQVRYHTCYLSAFGTLLVGSLVYWRMSSKFAEVV